MVGHKVCFRLQCLRGEGRRFRYATLNIDYGWDDCPRDGIGGKRYEAVLFHRHRGDSRPLHGSRRLRDLAERQRREADRTAHGRAGVEPLRGAGGETRPPSQSGDGRGAAIQREHGGCRGSHRRAHHRVVRDEKQRRAPRRRAAASGERPNRPQNPAGHRQCPPHGGVPRSSQQRFSSSGTADGEGSNLEGKIRGGGGPVRGGPGGPCRGGSPAGAVCGAGGAPTRRLPGGRQRAAHLPAGGFLCAGRHAAGAGGEFRPAALFRDLGGQAHASFVRGRDIDGDVSGASHEKSLRHRVRGGKPRQRGKHRRHGQGNHAAAYGAGGDAPGALRNRQPGAGPGAAHIQQSVRPGGTSLRLPCRSHDRHDGRCQERGVRRGRGGNHPSAGRGDRRRRRGIY